jgi:O-antigen/teichoic acid export membrane protein
VKATRTNSIHGLLGFAIPALVMLIAFPILLRHLGPDAFGIYILAMSITGTVLILDLGFSAATLKFVAEDVSKGDYKAAADGIIASFLFYSCLGLSVALVIWNSSEWLVSLFSIEDSLRADAVNVFRLSAMQFAVFFLTTMCISVFKGMQKFHLSMIALCLLALLTYGGALGGVVWGDISLTALMWITLTANLCVLGFSVAVVMWLCSQMGIKLHAARPSLAIFRRMAGFGAAFAVSSVAGILHAQLQRIFIGAALGPQYVSSFFLAVWGPAKLNSATLAMTEPLFPRTVFLAVSSDLMNMRRLYRKYFLLTSIISFLALSPLYILPEAIFSLWLGKSLPLDVPAVTKIVTIGLFFNAISQPATHVLNGMGKPWVNTAFTVLSPVVLYCLLLYYFLSKGSLEMDDFAYATAFSLIISAVVYLAWFEIFTMQLSEVKKVKSDMRKAD